MALDWTLLLSELILHHSSRKRPLYLCFFDAYKAFDRVWVDGLIYHLYHAGVRGPMLKLLFSMYTGSFTSLDVNGLRTPLVDMECGVKQGGVSSPTLYLVFINSLIEKLKSAGLGYRLGPTWIGILLFCDDTVILAESPEDLQKMIDLVIEHCRDWRCSMSLSKSVVMTVGCPFQSHEFTMNGSPLKEERQIKHLGCILSRNCSTLCQGNHLITKLESAIKGLMMIGLKSSEFSIMTSIRLFNTIALPSALYGTECLPLPLGVIRRMDVLSRKFFRHILCCVSHMPNDVLYGELGLMSLQHYQNLRSLQYFWRLKNLPSLHIISKLIMSLPSHESSFFTRCSGLLKLYNIAELPLDLSKQTWTCLVKAKIKFFCDQQWRSSIPNSSALARFYNLHKLWPSLDPYLEYDGYAGRLILKLRSGFSALYGCIQKYDDIAFEERLCPLCNQETEDSLHFLIRCPDLVQFRKFPPTPQAALDILNLSENQIDCKLLVELYSGRNRLLHYKNGRQAAT